jgi:hypothetical protein
VGGDGFFAAVVDIEAGVFPGEEVAPVVVDDLSDLDSLLRVQSVDEEKFVESVLS